MSDPYSKPNVAIDRVYTRGGDKGETSLVGGQRVPKTDPRIAAYGDVDELNALVGLVRAELLDRQVLPDLEALLLKVQHQLFNLGSVLATLPKDIGKDQPRVTADDVTSLETAMDDVNPGLAPLPSFVLPGGSHLNALLHLARTVCRRAERKVVALHQAGGCSAVEVHYLNRLSDALFVWSRLAAKALGHEEVLWDPGLA